MSILTKVIIVLHAIASVVLATLVVAQQQNIETYKGKWEDTKRAVEVAQKAAENAKADRNELISNYSEQLQKRDETENVLRGQLNTVQSTLGMREADLIAARSAFEELKGQAARNVETNRQLAALAQHQRDELNERRKRELELAGQVASTTTQLDEAETKGRSQEELIRFLKEQIEDVKGQYEKAVAQAKAASPSGTLPDEGPAAASVTPTVTVRGLVTEVQKLGEETFVALNVGENDKVAVGTKFMIHDGNAFLGSAVVTKVNLNSSAARVTLLKGEIRKNNDATSVDF